jgi:FkbM family methyltransferase
MSPSPEADRYSLARRLRRGLRRRWFWLRRDRDATEVDVKVSGFRMRLPSRFVDRFVFDRYEPVTDAHLADALRPGMVVLDIGAHVGYYTLVAAQAVGPSGKVHAFEPCAETLALLRTNVRANGFANVEVHPFAAGSGDSERTFHVTGSSDSHGLFPHPLTETVRTTEVRTVRVAQVVPGPVDLVKIDVEGAEFEALEGMGDLLSGEAPMVLIVEWNPACLRNAGRDPLKLPCRLQELGFTTISVLDDRRRLVRSVPDTEEEIASESPPPWWYVNLWATRS